MKVNRNMFVMTSSFMSSEVSMATSALFRFVGLGWIFFSVTQIEHFVWLQEIEINALKHRVFALEQRLNNIVLQKPTNVVVDMPATYVFDEDESDKDEHLTANHAYINATNATNMTDVTDVTDEHAMYNISDNDDVNDNESYKSYESSDNNNDSGDENDSISSNDDIESSDKDDDDEKKDESNDKHDNDWVVDSGRIIPEKPPSRKYYLW